MANVELTENSTAKSVTLDEEELLKVILAFVRGVYFSHEEDPDFDVQFFKVHNESIETHCSITLLGKKDE